MINYDHDKVLSHWEKTEVESMYDKHLLQAEIDLIRKRINEGSKVLDAGCGEGEGTLAYARIPGTEIHAADFSSTRLQKATERLQGHKNVTFKQVDFVGEYQLDRDYDAVICQRFLINLTDWEIQKKVLLDLMGLLRKGGRLFLLEGYMQGVLELNQFRSRLGLSDIPVQWHNLFFDDEKLKPFMTQQGFNLEDEDGLGAYFLLTRGVRPALQANLDWDCDFNKAAATDAVREMLGYRDRFSRLKLWVFRK